MPNTLMGALEGGRRGEEGRADGIVERERREGEGGK